MEDSREKSIEKDELITKNNNEIVEEKEQKFVNLVIEIIVSSTLKEYYEKGDQISKI